MAYRAIVLHLYTWDEIQFSPKITSRLCSQNLSLDCINLARIRAQPRQLILAFPANQVHVQDAVLIKAWWYTSVTACDFPETPPIVEDCQTSFVIVLLQTLHGQTTGVPHLQPGIFPRWRIQKYTRDFDRPACLQPLKVVWLSLSSFTGPDAKYTYNGYMFLCTRPPISQCVGVWVPDWGV